MFKLGESYVFFDGKERPYHGTTLVIAPYPPAVADMEDPQRKKARVVTRFSRFTPGMYFFQRVSPCGKYALIRLDKSAFGKDGNPLTSHTYYIVELDSGKTEKVLFDDTQLKSPQKSIVGLSWVANFQRK
jgi:hypothetical protein